ncbi:MAG: corrinoid protein-associated methyltransferase CpaM, partial [Candidatus Hodarchaeales archaeon]
MSYVYMKVLEETPEEYELKISSLTAGTLEEVYSRILSLVTEGDKVLELGCGPGSLAVRCAKKGANVVAIDISEKMIAYATEKSQKEDVTDRIKFIKDDITRLDTLLAGRKFDIVISTLALSELRYLEQQLVFDRCWEILVDDGIIAFADEVKPTGWGKKRLMYSLKRFFYASVTYWKTKRTTSAIKHFSERVKQTGYT